jgi:hypothetical protein
MPLSFCRPFGERHGPVSDNSHPSGKNALIEKIQLKCHRCLRIIAILAEISLSNTDGQNYRFGFPNR